MNQHWKSRSDCYEWMDAIWIHHLLHPWSRMLEVSSMWELTACTEVFIDSEDKLNYRTLVYCSSNNLTLNRHTKTLANKHKMPFNSTCQLGCRVIDLFNFFCCVDQEWHWATQEGHFIKIKDPHQQWTETRPWMSNLQSLGKSRGTQRSCNWRGLFILMNMFVNFLFVTHLAFIIMAG